MLTVITPVLNGADFIENNLLSVMQLPVNHEHIVVDGGSTDGTLDILQRYQHLKLVRQSLPNGMYGAINEGIKHSTGKYISYLNCDDEFEKGIFNLYEEIKTTGADLIYGDGVFDYRDSKRKVTIKGVPFGRFLLRNGIMPFIQPSSIFSRKAFDKLNGFDSEKFRLSGDLDFFQRIALDPKLKIKYVPTVSSKFLIHGNSLSYLNVEKNKSEMKMIRQKKLPNLFGRILVKARRLF